MTTVLAVWYAGIADRWADNSPLDVGFSLLEQANTWIWVLALLGTGRACSPAPVRGLGYASEASFPALCCTRPSSSRSPRRGGLRSRRGSKFATICLAGLALPLLLYEVLVRRTNATGSCSACSRGVPRRVPQRPSPALPKATNDLPIAPATPLPRPSTPSWCAWTPPTDGLPGRHRDLPAAEDGVGDRPPYRPYSTIPRAPAK